MVMMECRKVDELLQLDVTNHQLCMIYRYLGDLPSKNENEG